MPNIYQTPTRVENAKPKEILHTRDGLFIQGITLKAAQGVLEKGQVIAIETVGGLGVKYVEGAATDGSAVAVGILLEHCDTAAAEVFTTAALRGVFVKSKLVGLDAPAEADLNARTVAGLDMLIVA